VSTSPSLRTLARLVVLASVAACGGSAPPAAPPGPPPPAKPCEEAYADLTKYYAADPERRRPPTLHEGPFVSTCQQLPIEAQRCMLFSFMQAHANECDKTLTDAPPDVMGRLAAMAGK
jgi:hypothetical protein